MMSSLGKRIRKSRECIDFTQENLAESVGVSRTAVTKWENDSAEPTISNLISIAEVLNVSTDYLLGIEISDRKDILSDLSSDAIISLKKLIFEIKKR